MVPLFRIVKRFPHRGKGYSNPARTAAEIAIFVPHYEITSHFTIRNGDFFLCIQ
jgi:hypothetical protein